MRASLNAISTNNRHKQLTKRNSYDTADFALIEAHPRASGSLSSTKSPVVFKYDNCEEPVSPRSPLKSEWIKKLESTLQTHIEIEPSLVTLKDYSRSQHAQQHLAANTLEPPTPNRQESLKNSHDENGTGVTSISGNLRLGVCTVKSNRSSSE